MQSYRGERPVSEHRSAVSFTRPPFEAQGAPFRAGSGPLPGRASAQDNEPTTAGRHKNSAHQPIKRAAATTRAGPLPHHFHTRGPAEEAAVAFLHADPSQRRSAPPHDSRTGQRRRKQKQQRRVIAGCQRPPMKRAASRSSETTTSTSARDGYSVSGQ